MKIFFFQKLLTGAPPRFSIFIFYFLTTPSSHSFSTETFKKIFKFQLIYTVHIPFAGTPPLQNTDFTFFNFMMEFSSQIEIMSSNFFCKLYSFSFQMNPLKKILKFQFKFTVHNPKTINKKRMYFLSNNNSDF